MPNTDPTEPYDGEYVICRTFEEVDAVVDRVLAGETKLRVIAEGEAEVGLGMYLRDSLTWAMEQLHGD